MLPSTCILPSQLQRIEEKRAQKAYTSAMESSHIYAGLRRLEDPAGYLPPHNLGIPGASQAICRHVPPIFFILFHLLTITSVLFSLLGLSTIGIDLLRIRRINRHLDFITRDDMLLAQNDASKYLSAHDLKEAVEERGMYVFLSSCLSCLHKNASQIDRIFFSHLRSSRGLGHKDLQARLQWWLESIKPAGIAEATARRLALIISSR